MLGANDAVGTPARNELGISTTLSARPVRPAPATARQAPLAANVIALAWLLADLAKLAFIVVGACLVLQASARRRRPD